jgi:hypothetical protein
MGGASVALIIFGLLLVYFSGMTNTNSAEPPSGMPISRVSVAIERAWLLNLRFCDNANPVKRSAGFVGYAEMPFGVVFQAGQYRAPDRRKYLKLDFSRPLRLAGLK